jgi:hypothetical protein
MKKFTCLAACLLLSSYLLTAQDEGVIQKKQRIDRSKGIFIGLGPSFTLGKNIGDYSVGFNVEAGFVKRLNRILSIGPSVSYLSFKYDPEVTSVNGGAYVGSGDPLGWRTKYALPNLSYDYGYVVELEGGDLSLLSLALNLKINFVPIKDGSIFSVYGFAKPFVTLASRSEVRGSDQRYTYEIYEDLGANKTSTADDILHYNLGDDEWYYNYIDQKANVWDLSSYPDLKADTEITGGIFIGPGIEFMPTKPFSFFIQAAFGYTFPLTFVGTGSYEPVVASYNEEKFPLTKKGFPSVNLQVGASLNF